MKPHKLEFKMKPFSYRKLGTIEQGNLSKYSGSTLNVHPYLSSMVNYVHPTKFAGFDDAEKNDLHFKEPSIIYMKKQTWNLILTPFYEKKALQNI